MAGAGTERRAVAVTGADGFIGRALCASLAGAGWQVLRVTRATHGDLARADPSVLARALQGVDAVVHLAARAHVMHETAADPDAAFAIANVDATRTVVRAALEAGVRRFIHASTVKVHGESSPRGRPFHGDEVPAPQDAYARSKWRAEIAVAELTHAAPMSAVVLRLPLVYGPGVRGNFRTLWDAVAEKRWLPFAAIDNRRSVLGVANLCSAFQAAIDAPAGTYLLADADSVSTPGLVRAIARAQGVDANLAYVPTALLRAAGVVLGRREGVARLTDSLEVDSRAFLSATGWMPRVDLARSLLAMRDEHH